MTALTACGGGGGGGNGSNSPPTNDTTFGTLAITEANADALPLGVSLSEGALAFTQTAINAMVLYTSDAVAVRSCGNTGTLTVAHQDLDSSFDISTGDVVSVSLTDCFDRIIDGVGNGTVELSITTFMLSADTANITGSLVTPAPFAIAEQFDPALSVAVSADLSFSFSIQNPEVLQIDASGVQSLAIEVNGTTETISEFSIRKTATRNAPGSEAANVDTDTALDFFYESALLGGSFTCTSNSVTFSGGAEVPDSADILCRGLNSSAVRVAGANTVQVDAEGDGSFATLGTLDWNVTLDGFLKTDSGLVLGDLSGEIPLRVISTRSRDVIYDAPRDRLLITTSAQDPVAPNSLLAVSVSNNSTTTLLSFNDEPNVVRLSADGAVIYVSFTGLGDIHTFDAVTLQPGAVLSVQSNVGISSNYEVLDIAMSPVDADLLAVAFRFIGFGAKDTVVFDGGVQLPNSNRDPGTSESSTDFDRLEFAADGVGLFAGISGTTASAILFLDENGIASATRLANLFGSGVKRAGDRLVNGASVYDGDTLVRIGSFTGALPNAFALDEQNGLAYDVQRRMLTVYDSESYVPLASYDLVVNPDTVFTDIVPAGSSFAIVAEESLRLVDVADIEVQNSAACDVLALTTGDGDPYTQYQCPVTDVVYDTARNRIYAAIGSSLGVNGNSIAVIDTSLEVVESYLRVASEPRQLEITADGSLLHIIYDGADLLTTVDLASLSVSRTRQIDLVDTGTSLEPSQALKIAVSPLAADTVVMLLDELAGSFFGGLTVFQDGVPLVDDVPTTDLQGSPSNRDIQVVFDVSGSPYALIDDVDTAVVQPLTIGPSGLSAGAFFQLPGVPVGWWGRADVQGNEVFTPLGSVIDLVNQTGDARFDTRAPSFQDGGGLAIVADVPANEAFVLVSSGNGSGVGRYALDTGAFVGEQELPAFGPSRLIDIAPNQLGIVANPTTGLIVIDKAAIQ